MKSHSPVRNAQGLNILQVPKCVSDQSNCKEVFGRENNVCNLWQFHCLQLSSRVHVVNVTCPPPPPTLQLRGRSHTPAYTSSDRSRAKRVLWVQTLTCSRKSNCWAHMHCTLFYQLQNSRCIKLCHLKLSFYWDLKPSLWLWLSTKAKHGSHSTVSSCWNSSYLFRNIFYFQQISPVYARK